MSAERWNAIALVAFVLAAGIGGPWLVREVRSLPRGTALAARADQRIVTLEVGGMTCQGCAGVVKGGLASTPGVAAVEVRLAQRRAYVVCDRAVADTALTGAIARAGPGFLGAVVAR
jgi:copper chaperone CopZ